jgi:hypothetical protein
VRFPLDEPLPLELIGRIARSRAQENLKRARDKERRKKPKATGS